MNFSSVSPSGFQAYGFPIGNHLKLQGYKLLDADKPLVSLPKIFIMFQDVTHEEGMVSVKKQAGFTIVAKDKTVGITRQDIVDQVPRIVRLMMNNPDIFDMRPWSNYDWLWINGIYNVMPGYFQIGIMQNMNDPDDFDEEYHKELSDKNRHGYDQFVLKWAAKKLEKDISEISLDTAKEMYAMAHDMASEVEFGEDD
jgi:hypothetical protein